MEQLGLPITGDSHPVPPNERFWIPCGCHLERTTLHGGRYAYVTYAKPLCQRHAPRVGTSRAGHLYVPADAAPADVDRALQHHNLGERDHASH
ncbi:hypothetical protein [Thioalkalivibrio sp. ALJ8]|uniref:hypothetical protein n=1 Tax=Thioalkalivibrio sp. ALJ8 TaxID=1158757 RepID=UPI00036DE681|nr:hypothetical protein [Thioalkalivibrio sp. ALJ8]